MIDSEQKTPLQILTERKLKAEADASLRRQELLEKDSDFAALESILAGKALEIFEAMRKNDGELASKLESEICELAEKEKALLNAKGYGEDYLKPAYYCSKCGDKGMVEVSEGVFERCTCYRQLILDTWNSESSLNIKNVNFKKFDQEFYPDDTNKEKYGIDISPRENAKKNLAVCKKFTEQFSEKTRDMLFTGGTGLGKTFLCSCITSELLAKEIPVMYISAYRLFASVFAFDSEDREKAKVTEELLRTTQVLIIDDLGAESVSDAKKAFLLDILNERDCRNGNFPCKTIISTNLSVSDIFAIYGERLGSRILGRFNVLKFAGNDVRLEKAMKKS